MSGVRIYADGVSIIFNVTLSTTPQVPCRYMVNVFDPPGGVGIACTLNETEVLPAGNVIVPGTVVTSTPFTAVPPNVKLSVVAVASG